MIGNTLLVLGSMAVVFLGMEGYLWADSVLDRPNSSPPLTATAVANVPPVPLASGGFVPPEIVAAAAARYRFTTMPEEWRHREVKIPGTVQAYYWQGVLHVIDAQNATCRGVGPQMACSGFRRATPFPVKDPNVFRVIVVGDSLTYGEGVAEKNTFTSLLEQWLSKDYSVELLNLGYSGYQSEDVLHVIKTWIPKLQPNLVIYAVCQNDFLPSGVGQYDGDQYAFPLPGRVKRFLVAHTRTGALLNDKYDAALRSLHLRRDFFDDILADFAGYQRRFTRDVADMNRTVMAAGLPPMIAMVVDQFPSYGSRGYRITQVAEDALRKAGDEVIPTEDYYRRYDNQNLYVSAWEGHPNEVANYVWAKMIYQQLILRKDLSAFRR